VLALGLVLLVAALLGAIALRHGLPAIVAYLLIGLAVGPFTPGAFVDSHQLVTALAAGAISNGMFSAVLAAVVSIALSAIAVRLFGKTAAYGLGFPVVSMAVPASGGVPRFTVFFPLRVRYARQARPVTASRWSLPST
jgi:Kef-type K+ transport system membrane component KefB